MNIAEYLLQHRRWVSGKEICKMFDVDERDLRRTGNRPGLLSDIAISGNDGFKHVAHATPEEYLRFKHRLRRHAIGEMQRVAQLDKERHRIRRATPREEVAGQLMMFGTRN